MTGIGIDLRRPYGYLDSRKLSYFFTSVPSSTQLLLACPSKQRCKHSKQPPCVSSLHRRVTTRLVTLAYPENTTHQLSLWGRRQHPFPSAKPPPPQTHQHMYPIKHFYHSSRLWPPSYFPSVFPLLKVSPPRRLSSVVTIRTEEHCRTHSSRRPEYSPGREHSQQLD